MSEYQYYEFQALDRPLTEREMRELRGYSTRAAITLRGSSTTTSGADSKEPRQLGWRSTSTLSSTSPTGARTS
jgi:hypothetical protein